MISLLNPFHHFLYHLERSRAVLYILFVDVHIVYHLSLGMMRKSCAICRTNFIYAAFVCSEIKELARLRFVQPVAISINVKPLFFEFTWRHIQVRRDSLY